MQIQDNTPSAGYIAWSSVHISYKGKTYSIPDGNTNSIYTYWLYSSPSAFQFSNTFPTLSDNDIIVFLNKNGIHATVPNTTIIDGSLIVPESIMTNALAANSVTATQLAAGSVTANAIAANAIGANAIAANAVTANKLNVNSLSAISANLGNVTAGDINIGSGKFHVDSSGNLTATSANITGTINATSGTFTGTITATGGTSSNPGDDKITIGQGSAWAPLTIMSKSDNNISVSATSSDITMYQTSGYTSIMAGSIHEGSIGSSTAYTDVNINDIYLSDGTSSLGITGSGVSLTQSDTTRDTINILGDMLGLGANITLYSHSQGKNAIDIDSGGNIAATGNISSGGTIDVGGSNGLRLINAPGSAGGNENKLTYGSDANGLSTKNNVNIDTWQGFSVCPSSPTSSNPIVPQGVPAFSVSARDGNVYVAHWLYTQSITGLNGGALGLFGGANVRNSSNSAWASIAASAFNVQSSVDLKQDITPMTASGLGIINDTDIYNFHYIGDVEEGKANLKYGVIIGPDYKTPSSLLNYENDAVDLYNWNGIITKGMQELYQKVQTDEATITTLINTNKDLVSKVSALQAKIGG